MPPFHHHHQHERPAGPSRLRRRERRAAKATENLNKSEEAALKAGALSPTRSNAAVQAAQADPQLGRHDDQLQVLLSQLYG